MIQLPLWGAEPPPPAEHWIMNIYSDGKRAIVSTLDPRVDWNDPTVLCASFVNGPVENTRTPCAIKETRRPPNAG